MSLLALFLFLSFLLGITTPHRSWEINIHTKIIPDSRQNAKEITRLSEAQVVDSDYAFDASKVRDLLL